MPNGAVLGVDKSPIETGGGERSDRLSGTKLRESAADLHAPFTKRFFDGIFSHDLYGQNTMIGTIELRSVI